MEKALAQKVQPRDEEWEGQHISCAPCTVGRPLAAARAADTGHTLRPAGCLSLATWPPATSLSTYRGSLQGSERQGNHSGSGYVLLRSW